MMRLFTLLITAPLFLTSCGMSPPEGDPILGMMAVDYDFDHILNGFDNCPFLYNPDQGDGDFDFVGNACDMSSK